MAKNDYSSTIRGVAELHGGVEKLAEQLGVDVAELTAWSEGRGTPPAPVLLRLADLVLTETAPLRASVGVVRMRGAKAPDAA